ncbi:MAG: recombinase family protein [Candidatus Sericytochromatia bacterium]|nr:recombinase family protein [Candidatus Sericytochromatia bacterium]
MSSAVGYLWLSPEQKEDAAIVKADTEALENFCRANNLRLQEISVESGTVGAALERPILSSLLQRPEVTLLIPSLAALGRRFHDVATVLSEINFLGHQLIAVAEDIDTNRPEGQQLLKVFVSIPQVARLMRSPAVEQPRVFVRNKEVLHNGGTCPYGYTLDEASNQFKVLPLEANVVRRIFRERIAGRSLRQIANDLGRDDIATKRGGRWQANTVKTILENLFYTGAYQCQNRIYHNDHEAIINEELFRQVNSNLDVVQVVS